MENSDMIYALFAISYNFSQEVIIPQLSVDFVGLRIKLSEKKIVTDSQLSVKSISQKSDLLKSQSKMAAVFPFFAITR